MKKLLTMGLAMILLGLLMGCSNDADDEGKSSETREANENVEITLWLDNDEYAEVLIAALEAELPQISFIYENVGTVDALDKLALDGPAGLGGDIMIVPHDVLADGLSQNLLLPLGTSLGESMEDRFLENAMGTITHDDNYFGMPLSTESIALFYNQTLLDEYVLEVATSFEELIEQAEVFNHVDSNDFILRFEASNAYVSHFFLTAHGFELFGSNHDDSELVNLNTPEVVAGLEFFQSIREILPVPAGDLTGDTTVGAFTQGEVPYVITGPWSISEIHTEGEFDWGVTTLPTINGAQPISFSGNIIGIVSAFTEHPEIAREVLSFMASDEGLEILYEYRDSIPALKDVSTIAGVAADPYILGVLEQARYSHPMPIISEMQSYWSAAEGMYESVWEGLLTPEAAAEKALADYNAALFIAQ